MCIMCIRYATSNHTSCKPSIGADDPVAAPKIFALPYGERLKILTAVPRSSHFFCHWLR